MAACAKYAELALQHGHRLGGSPCMHGAQSSAYFAELPGSDRAHLLAGALSLNMQLCFRLELVTRVSTALQGHLKCTCRMIITPKLAAAFALVDQNHDHRAARCSGH